MVLFPLLCPIFAQSANIFELLGERYQGALSHLALGRLAARTGTPSIAEKHLDTASTVFQMLGETSPPAAWRRFVDVVIGRCG